ncbi:hypothetical protein ACFV2X_48110 [Streptomyces sp. NPDC059679]|uniref:hypothetical protein n=1 Tax=Streptomyces sp. NPDC059679 TaxID=3346903 RepID=UPI0036742A90
MIRAGRKHLVLSLADLAALEGLSESRFKTKQMHKRPGHPTPINAAGATTKQLYDGEQVDDFRAGRDIALLPQDDHDDDLLDRHEAAALVQVAVASWDRYKREPWLAERVVVVKGVEHWPRHIILTWAANRPGLGRGGRPKGTGDLIPREDIQPRTAELLAADPAVTAETVGEALGVHPDTAQRALTAVRAGRVQELLADRPELTPEEVTAELGYPLRTARTALALAQANQRAADAAPYLQSMLQALDASGIAVADVSGVVVRPGAVCSAAVTLSQAPAPVLVWDERYGWRTAADRPNLSRGEAEPPAGPGIRYLAHGITPDPRDVITALADRRTGTKRPRTVR